jgi:hypothetical protein
MNRLFMNRLPSRDHDGIRPQVAADNSLVVSRSGCRMIMICWVGAALYCGGKSKEGSRSLKTFARSAAGALRLKRPHMDLFLLSSSTTVVSLSPAFAANDTPHFPV